MTAPRDWLTVKEAAERLGVIPMTIYRYIKDGKLEASQILPGGKFRISAASLEKLLNPAKEDREPRFDDRDKDEWRHEAAEAQKLK